VTWLWLALIIPVAWIAWQAFKIFVGATVPLEIHCRNIIARKLQTRGVSVADVGEPSLTELGSYCANIARAVGGHGGRSKQEVAWYHSDMIADELISLHLHGEGIYFKDQSITNEPMATLRKHNSPILANLKVS
jgi:hypothetical protein